MTIAYIYFGATRHYKITRDRLPLAPYLRLSNKEIGEMFIPILSKVTKQELKQVDIDKLLSFYDFGSDTIYDLYFKPILTYEKQITIVPSLLMMNNFPRIFPHHLNMLKVNLEEKGETYEVVMRNCFKQNGFTIFTERYPYTYNYEGSTLSGDIDIIARLGNYLFVGQSKNKLEPIDTKNQISVDRTIRKAIKQAKGTIKYIQRNQEEFALKMNIPLEELADLTIQPFVLINCFYGSGQVIDDIPVIDTSAIYKYFEGKVQLHRGNEVFTQRIRPEGPVEPLDFKNHLYSPYFLNPTIYSFSLRSRHVQHIDGKKFSIGPELQKEHFSNSSFLEDGFAYFFKNDMLSQKTQAKRRLNFNSGFNINNKRRDIKKNSAFKKI